MSTVSEGGEFQEWSDVDDSTSVTCLLCPSVFPTLKATHFHLVEEHSFSIVDTIKRNDYDFHAQMKLVNYIRFLASNGSTLDNDIATLISMNTEWLESDAYLKPFIVDDALLFDLERLLDELSPAAPEATPLQLSEDKNKILEARLRELTLSFTEYKHAVQDKLLGQDAVSDKDIVHNPKEWSMDGYFSGYAHSDIHETMLKDTVRTEAYRDFVYENKEYFKGKVVLDVGCGTGILSMFAARGGARHVYAVDNSTIINFAKQNAQENGLGDIITFIQGKIEDVTLPEKVDVIISEWMGYFLLFEAMLDSVLKARDLFLKEDGILAPSNATMMISLFEDEAYLFDKHDYWNQVYGFGMTAMKGDLKKDGQVVSLGSECVCSNIVNIKDIDIKSDSVASLDFVSEFRFELIRDASVHGVAGWFDCLFDGPSLAKITLPTGPTTTQTHWRQTLFLFNQTIVAKKGEIVEGSLECRKKPDYERGLLVTIKYTFRGDTYEQVYIVG